MENREIQKTEKPTKESLERELKEKFWELQKEQKKSGEEIKNDWNSFAENFANESEDLTLYICAEEAGEKKPKINCDHWVFPFKVGITGIFEEASFADSLFKKKMAIGLGLSKNRDSFISKAKFSRAKFHEGAIFENATLLGAWFSFAKFFKDDVTFRSVDFECEARFLFCQFQNCKVIFSESKFVKSFDLENVTIDRKASFEFTKSRFLDEFNFCVIGRVENQPEITKIDLSSSKFENLALFRQEKSSDGKFVRIGGLDLTATTFREPLVIKFQHLESCPDFSKSYLLDIKKLSLNEKSWEKNDEIRQQEITEDDEAKFRFLKKYFADQGNHFKEREYFSYEMMAREKKLRSQVFSRTAVTNWLKNFFEFVLFFAYKWTSNFGMSWVRPAFWLLVSSRLMALRLDKIPPLSPIEKFGEFFYFPENSTAGFFEALTRTLLPLSTAKIFDIKTPYDSYDWAGNIHCIANAILIFLLLLGLRNKFKIK